MKIINKGRGIHQREVAGIERLKKELPETWIGFTNLEMALPRGAREIDLIIIAEDRSADPRVIVETRGLKQVTDTGAIESAVDAIIAANPDKVAQAIAKPTLLGWFVGQVMKSTGGKANPQAVNDMLKQKLGV